MAIDNSLQDINGLTLQWHSGASTMGFEAFRPWVVMTLKPRLRFDGAIWALLTEPGAGGITRMNSTYVHRIADSAMDSFESARAQELSGERKEGEIVSVSLPDSQLQSAAITELREHALRFNMTHTISAQYADAKSRSRQFIMLTRSADESAFSADEIRQFALLAPHMMQAYATSRKLLLDSTQGTGRRLAGLAVAMVDRAGEVHDHHGGFGPMIRREWSDWPGSRLPEPMRQVIARRAGAPWRFLGVQICADFAPVDDLYLVTARPRHAADPLTPRENEVARQYAAGGSFREIASVLQLSPATVRSHLRNVFGKMHVRSKTQLASLLR